MNTEKEPVEVPAPDLNEDPITHEPGSHPVATGVGAAGAGTIGVAIGTAVAGPIGALVGAAVGAFVGGLGGSAVGEVIDPTASVVTAKKSPDDEEMDADIAATNLNPSGYGGLSSSEPVALIPVDYLSEEAGPTFPSTGEATPTDEEIAARAHSIYEAEGFPEGRALEHWQQAKEELKHY